MVQSRRAGLGDRERGRERERSERGEGESDEYFLFFCYIIQIFIIGGNNSGISIFLRFLKMVSYVQRSDFLAWGRSCSVSRETAMEASLAALGLLWLDNESISQRSV